MQSRYMGKTMVCDGYRGHHTWIYYVEQGASIYGVHAHGWLTVPRSYFERIMKSKDFVPASK